MTESLVLIFLVLFLILGRYEEKQAWLRNELSYYVDWRGRFCAHVQYAPYMPLAITEVLPFSVNPLIQQKAAFMWGGIDPVFSTKLVMESIDVLSEDDGAGN